MYKIKGGYNPPLRVVGSQNIKRKIALRVEIVRELWWWY
jgi:hypothetical protein